MSGTDITPQIIIEGESHLGDKMSKAAKIIPSVPPMKVLSPVDKAVCNAQLAKCVKKYSFPSSSD